MKPILTATVYGFFAGVITAAVLHIMRLLENFVWSNQNLMSPLLIFALVMFGGFLVALCRYHDPTQNFDGQLIYDEDGKPDPISRAANVAALGTASVVFGGAIGPEGGVIAVVAALSDFIAKRISKDVREQSLIRQVGIAAALSAIYRSPPGGASYADMQRQAPWPLLLIAGLTGLAGIYAGSALFPKGEGLEIPVPAPGQEVDLGMLLYLILPAVAGAIAAIVYLFVKLWGDRILNRLSKDVRIRVLAGSFVFAIIIALWPDFRSNGQNQLYSLSAHPEVYGASTLYLSAIIKAVAMAVCLAAGWLGGPIMPLSFMGVCSGLAVSQLVPGLDPGLAAITGAGAAACVGMNQPIIVLMVLLFMTTHVAPVAISVGTGIGVLITMLLPPALLKHAGHN